MNDIGSAIVFCKAAGRSDALKLFQEKFTFPHYESLVRSAPWKRYHATLTLKKICALFIVCVFFFTHFSLN